MYLWQENINVLKRTKLYENLAAGLAYARGVINLQYTIDTSLC